MKLTNSTKNRKPRKCLWRPMNTAPTDGRYVQLLLDSGYTTTPYIIAIARYEKEYQGIHRWRDHTNDSIMDRTDRLVGWRPWTPPELDYDPDESLYRYLDNFDSIKPGDEFEREDGVWIKLSEQDIKSWKHITGKALAVDENSKRVRRSIYV